MKTKLTIERFPVNDKKGEWQTALQRLVSHHFLCPRILEDYVVNIL